MSHSSHSSEHAPGSREKALANLVAGTIIGFFRLLISVFSTVFRALSSFA